MAEDRTQKRLYPRIPAQNALLVKKLGEEVLEGFAPASTLSLGGCSFLSDEPLGVGSALELSIAIERRVVSTTARVVHEHRVDDGRFEVGVAFLDLAAEEQEILEKLFEED